MSSGKRWIPLESNPEVLTKFAHRLGLSPLLKLSDVWGLDLLDMVPAPRYAVMLLFPITDALHSVSEGGDAALATAEAATQPTTPYFCSQTIGNACGTIALLHAAANAAVAAPHAPPADDGFFARFAAATAAMSGPERAAALEKNDMLDSVHEQFAQEGQTAPPDPDEKINLHFVCFVERAGVLYELDGRKAGPVAHGASSPDSLLQDAAKVIKSKFMDADPTEHRFTIMALTMSDE